jgi:outer membrane protein assembly factor BamE
MREKYPAYSESIKRAIDRNSLIRGMDHDQVYLALGEPMCKKTIERNDKPVEVWLYPPGGREPCRTAEFRVYFEEGAVAEWGKVPAPRGGG